MILGGNEYTGIWKVNISNLFNQDSSSTHFCAGYWIQKKQYYRLVFFHFTFLSVFQYRYQRFSFSGYNGITVIFILVPFTLLFIPYFLCLIISLMAAFFHLHFRLFRPSSFLALSPPGSGSHIDKFNDTGIYQNHIYTRVYRYTLFPNIGPIKQYSNRIVSWAARSVRKIGTG
jgi:hypothetical protein